MKSEYPQRLPITAKNHKAIRVRAAEEDKSISEMGNELLADALALKHTKGRER